VELRNTWPTSPANVKGSATVERPAVCPQVECFRRDFTENGRAELTDRYVVTAIEGTGQVIYRARAYALLAGDILLMRPNEVYRYSVLDAPFRVTSMAVATSLFEGVASGPGQKPPLEFRSLRARPDTGLKEAFARLRWAIGESARRSSVEIALTRLIRRIALHQTTRPGESPEHYAPLCPGYVRRARAYLEDRSYRVSLAELELAVNKRRHGLLRRFKESIGVPPAEYQKLRRLNEAKRLLRNGVSPVETAKQAGYYDQPHLTRHFREVCGVTPGQFGNGSTDLQLPGSLTT